MLLLSSSELGHAFLRERKCNRVHTVAQAGWVGAVVEHVPQMRVAPRAFHFAPQHAQTEVVFLAYVFAGDHFPEARPSRARFEFRFAVKQRRSAIRATVNSRSMFVQ